MAKVVAKKRSTINERSILTPPAEFDSKKFAGRWVSDSKLNARSDGYETRGFTPWKNAQGQIVKVGDLVWCYMTKEEALRIKQEKLDLAREAISGIQERIEDEDSRLSFELERAGGKLVTTVNNDQ